MNIDKTVTTVTVKNKHPLNACLRPVKMVTVTVVTVFRVGM